MTTEVVNVPNEGVAQYIQLHIHYDNCPSIFDPTYSLVQDEFGKITWEMAEKEGCTKLQWRVLRALFVGQKAIGDYIIQERK